ncbi:C45 family autoproteolytic acyltransferase/hydolase [Oceanobacillus jeddahense]|uniref:C45 family autoproteolytic acyltransferase/hydolase n=1 Tax=Oceanobacillus jeddahense TaxID=1462527 RepID=UPI00362C82B9
MESLHNKKNTRSTKSFPFYRFEGNYREIGQQYGESCRGLIKLHREYALERLQRSIKLNSFADLENAALEYQPFVQKYAPFFDEEIQGLAEGANISLGEAYFLQLRAEIYQHLDATDECTTFAVSSEATSNGVPLIGQNADLPSFYKEVGVVIEAKTVNKPSTLMVTPAGQISYIGINDKGLGVFANFIVCGGWRVGFPRYLLSRLALTEENLNAAIKTVSQVYRASSRNLIMMERSGRSVDLETIPKRVGRIDSSNGLLEHSNHFISEELKVEERKTDEELENSEIRLLRMRELLRGNYGQLNVEKMQTILRDRKNAPHTLCRVPGDFGKDYGKDTITFASVIAEPSKGRLWIAIGPPNEYEYKCYSFL